MADHRRLSSRGIVIPVSFLDVVFLLLMSIIQRNPNFDLKDILIPAIQEPSGAVLVNSEGGQKDRLSLVLRADGVAMWKDEEFKPADVLSAVAEDISDKTTVVFAVEVDGTGSGSIEGYMQIASDAARVGLWNQFVVVHKGNKDQKVALNRKEVHSEAGNMR